MHECILHRSPAATGECACTWRTNAFTAARGNNNYNSLKYVINSTFRKIFNTRSQEVVDICLEMFNCLPAEKAIANRKRNFWNNKFCVNNNELCKIFTDNAKKELAILLADV